MYTTQSDAEEQPNYCEMKISQLRKCALPIFTSEDSSSKKQYEHSLGTISFNP